MSVIRYTPHRPFVVHVNHTGATLAVALSAPPPAQSRRMPPSEVHTD